MNRLVMVVDDSLTIRTILDVCLRRAGYEVKTFQDGVEVFNWLATPQARIPALVLVDLGLPKIDGYNLIRLLRTRPAFAHTAFVIVSRRDGVLDKLKGRLVGARAYLTKPFLTTQILAIARQYTTGCSVEQEKDCTDEYIQHTHSNPGANLLVKR